MANFLSPKSFWGWKVATIAHFRRGWPIIEKYKTIAEMREVAGSPRIWPRRKLTGQLTRLKLIGANKLKGKLSANLAQP
jgi:hypothetical protein